MQIENLLVEITIGKGNEYSNEMVVYITIMLCWIGAPLECCELIIANYFFRSGMKAKMACLEIN
jgi:hypothetical protein